MVRVGRRQECAREGIVLEPVQFADNSETVRLIDGPSGILSMLQEEGALPKGGGAAVARTG